MSINIEGIHHIAIIASNIEVSKAFYLDVLGCTVIQETYRPDRDSWKVDLALNNTYIIELFSFPDSPPRVNQPEACGLRHLAFSVSDIKQTTRQLKRKNIPFDELKKDPLSNKYYTFIKDPDGLPIEFYQI